MRNHFATCEKHRSPRPSQKSTTTHLSATNPCTTLMIWALSLLFLIGGGSGFLSAQTAWSINPDAPTNLPSDAKLKYANGAFRLVWKTEFDYYRWLNSTNLNATPDIPTPYSLLVYPWTMGLHPATSSAKKLTIRYATSAGQYEAVVQEGSSLTIPNASHTLVGPAQAVAGFVVVSATYGTTTNFVNVENSFRTRTLELPYYSFWTQWDDFTYDAAGSLILFGNDHGPALAYPNASGTYQITNPNSFGYSFNGSKSCGVYGQGKMVMGLSGRSFPYSQAQPLIQTPSPGNYNYFNWTSPSLSPGFQVKQIIYEAGKFMAVGSRSNSSEVYYTSETKGAILLSQDGVEWTTVVIPGTTSLEAVCYKSGQWVAVGDSGSVLTSSNGYEWVKTTIPTAGNLTSVASGNGYCAVGTSTGTIYTTRDFASWAVQNRSSGSVSSLAVGDGRFMALVGNRIYQSRFSPAGIVDIVSQPANTFVIPQQAVNLSVGAVGAAQVSYQWYEGYSGNYSAPIIGAVNSSYQTPPLTVTKSYWVRVSNGLGGENSLTTTLTMQATPAITAQPTSKILAMGSNVSSTIMVTGNNISYQWYRGYTGDVSIPLAGKTSASLTLPALLPGVSYYWVKVNNGLGTLDSATIQAEVTAVLPTIVDEPLDTTTYQTVYSLIYVTATGPSLSYQWYGGVRGDTSHPLSETSSYLTPPDDLAGNYQFWVRISNPLGFVDSRTVRFSVIRSQAPMITMQPSDTATYLGSSKSISVSVEGENLNYAWYGGESGDTSVLLANSSSNYYPASGFSGSYRYWVRISNPSGVVNSVAITYTVSPLGLGLISKQPLNEATQVGNSLSLSVTSTDSNSTYQWYSGVSGDTSALLSASTSSTYYPSTSIIGQRSYWVQVTSGTVVENSETAVVTVIPRILAITDQPMDRSTYVGDSISYYVFTQGSNLTYQWYVGLSGDTSSPLADKTSYSFDPPVNVAGINRYWMRAFSGSTYVDSLSATVTVIGRPPVITTHPESQVFELGATSISLTAGVDNSTGVTWQWYEGSSGNTSLALSGRTSATLDITNPPAGNSVYWVRATNSYGSADSRTATLSIDPFIYTGWLVQNGLPANGLGSGAFSATPNEDGVPNLLKYVLGMKSDESFDTIRGPHTGTLEIGGNTYLTLKFVQSLTAPSAQLVVEESANLSDWNTTAIECGPSYNNGDGTRTRTFRHTQPMTSSGTGFLRLKATSN